MTVVFKTGNILEDSAQALVNPVNCVGVMGKGLALAFKQKYPDYYREYKEYCDDGMMRIGKCHLWYPSSKAIISFPTKNHWRDVSTLAFIEAGLLDLSEIVTNFGINSIAIPALGCGLGGLEWWAVKPLIVNWANQHERVGISTTIYAPL